MALLNNDIRDDGLNVLVNATTAIYVCSQEPTTRTEAVTTYALGSKDPISVGAPADSASGGREVTVPAFSDGTVSANGTATHYAIVDGTRLLVVNTLTPNLTVSTGNPFALGSFTIDFPDEVSQ